MHGLQREWKNQINKVTVKVNKLLFRILDNWHHLGAGKKMKLERWTSVVKHLTNGPFNTNYHAVLPSLLVLVKYLDILWENVSYKWQNEINYNKFKTKHFGNQASISKAYFK